MKVGLLSHYASLLACGTSARTLPLMAFFILSSNGLTLRVGRQIGEVVTTIPTIGFNVESVTYKNLNFNVWV